MNDGTATRLDNGGLVAEELPSLADFAQEPGGAWPNGWYGADIIEGYTTGNGKIWETTDEVSQKGDSRNLRLCLKMRDGKLGERNTWTSLNYRLEDFTPAKLAQVKEMREQFRGQRGAWPGQTDVQRTSLAIASLGQLEKALGFRLKLHPAGHILAVALVTHKVDIRLGTDEKGYNEVTAFAQTGTRAKR